MRIERANAQQHSKCFLLPSSIASYSSPDKSHSLTTRIHKDYHLSATWCENDLCPLLSEEIHICFPCLAYHTIAVPHAPLSANGWEKLKRMGLDLLPILPCALPSGSAVAIVGQRARTQQLCQNGRFFLLILCL
jgi:hypothetical protein